LITNITHQQTTPNKQQTTNSSTQEEEEELDINQFTINAQRERRE